MATLILDYGFEEGTGTTTNDASTSGNDGSLIVVGDYPKWVTGYNGSGYALEHYSAQYTGDDTLDVAHVVADDSVVCSLQDGYVVYASFKISNGTIWQSSLFGLIDYQYNSSPRTYTVHDNGLYVVDGRVWFGCVGIAGGGGSTWGFGVGSDDTDLNDGNWHTAIGRASLHSQGTPKISRVLNLWIDGIKQSGSTTIDANTYAVSTAGRPVIGYSLLGRPGSLTYIFPGLISSAGGYAPRAVIDNCKVYCGELTDEEIESGVMAIKAHIFTFSGGLA